MKLRLAQLEAFWARASEPMPLLILGAGRWGRTWARVAAAARGGTEGIALVARSNYAETKDWAAADSLLGHLPVVSDLSAAMHALRSGAGRTCVAIVASRPRAHREDACRCLAAGMTTLVENPLASSPEDAATIAGAASSAGSGLALGVEFSLTPAFHYVAHQFAQGMLNGRIQWTDPASEFRHGDRKRVHEEVSVLEGIAPHAMSIWRIFAPAQAWRVASARLDDSSERGTATLRCGESEWRFKVDRCAASRVRRLELESADGGVVSVDFAAPRAEVLIDGEILPIPAEWARLDSNLRLELGALFMCAVERTRTPVSEALSEYVNLHWQLRRALA
jgi:predicted dehydrogenase